MRVLVVYASRYGATRGIAERIAGNLNESGHEASAASAKAVSDLDGYDAFVVGSAVFIGSWMKEASEFVRRNHEALAARPAWLFSSGPVGPTIQQENVRETAVPREIAEFETLIRPRGHRVFCGAFDHTRLDFGHRLIYAMPAMKKLMVDGDYRDWSNIDAWAVEIADALSPAVVSLRG